MKKALIIMLVLLVQLTGKTQNHVWTGANSNVWGDPQNWDMGTVPGPGDKAVIPQGTPYCGIVGNVTVGEIKNLGEVKIYNVTDKSTISTSGFTNEGTVTQSDPGSSTIITGIGENKVEVTNNGTIKVGNYSVNNGSTVTNSGMFDAKKITIQSDVLENKTSSTIDASKLTIKSGTITNNGTVEVRTIGSSNGLTIEGKVLHNEGTINATSMTGSSDPIIEIKCTSKVENYPNGSITASSITECNKVKVVVSAPKVFNYGKISGYKTITEKGTSADTPFGAILLVSEDLVVEDQARLVADKIILVFHDFYSYLITVPHSIEGTSGIELRGDKGSFYLIQGKCAEDLYYSSDGAITVLCDSIRCDSSAFQYLCDPDPLMGPADTTYVSGMITSASVTDSVGGSGTFRVILQNQGTGHRSFDYAITSPCGWITPVSGTTQLLGPFQYDSIFVNYEIPEHPSDTIEYIRQLLSVPGIFSDTSYSFISVSDSINLAINELSVNSNEFDFVVYPNPVSEFCRICSNRNAKIEIYTPDGKYVTECFVTKGQPLIWNMPGGFKPGVYFFHGRSGNQHRIKKAVLLN